MKRKIILAVAVMLVLVMALSSCGASGNKIENILNADFDVTATVYGEATNVAELDGYVVDHGDSNSYFLVFTKADIETAAVTTKIFNLETGKVVYTFTSSDTVVYTLETFYDVPAFALVSTPVPAPEATEEPDSTFYLYDATGAEVVNTTYAPEDPYMVGEDLVIYNYVGYTVDDEGKFEKKMDIPEYVLVDDIDRVTDEYYYAINEDEVIVYDLEFNVVSNWQAPSYVYEDGYNLTTILNNGDIFVQYFVLLDEDATDFDVYDEDGKYNMVQMVVNAKTGKAKEVKLDYMVMSVYSNKDLNRPYDDDNLMYTDKFDNLAVVFPIIDQNVDMTNMAMDIVTMGNNGKIKSTLNYVENLVTIGAKVADDLYIVRTTAATVVINGNGKVVKTLNNNLDICGSYFYGDVAIYDLEFNVVYNLLENKAEVMDTVGDTIFVKAETDTGYEVIAFNGGEQKTVYTYNKEAEVNTAFDLVDGVGYYILDGAAGEYVYYNANGDVIIKTTTLLSVVTANEDIVVFSSTVDEVVKYYVAAAVATDAE